MSRHRETPPADHEGRPRPTLDDRQTVVTSIPFRGLDALTVGGAQ
ncbi:Uncharacterised protein [Clostridioides difficile]|nr:Uncharacterised protein [Clostridioides difficile]